MERRYFYAIDISKNATQKLKRLSQNGFQECFQHLYSHCQKYIIAQADYFDGNVSLIVAIFYISKK